MRCLSCKYDLRNLTEHRCPECGRAFDPNDQRDPNHPQLWGLWSTLTAVGLVLMPIWMPALFIFVVMVWGKL